MKYKELEKKPKEELFKLLGETKESLREMRFKVANRSLKSIRDFRQAKKMIAKILTVLNNQKNLVKKN